MESSLTIGSTSVTFKRAVLYLLAGAIGICAVLGILAILTAHFGWFEARVMLTTVVVALAGLCGLANGAYLATGRGYALPWAGIVLSMLAGGLLLIAVWVSPREEFFWKAAAIASIYAVACGHLSLLSIARLASNYVWSMVVAWVLIFGVATTLTVLILGEMGDSEIFRLLAIAAILDAAITILIPIFHKLSAAELGENVGAAGATNMTPNFSELESLDRQIAELRENLDALESRRRTLSASSYHP